MFLVHLVGGRESGVVVCCDKCGKSSLTAGVAPFADTEDAEDWLAGNKEDADYLLPGHDYPPDALFHQTLLGNVYCPPCTEELIQATKKRDATHA